MSLWSSPGQDQTPLSGRQQLDANSLRADTLAASSLAGPKADAAAAALKQQRRSQRRPAALVQAIGQLDAHASAGTLNEVADWIKQEYDALDLPDLLGFFQSCALGRPYVDHTLNLGGRIIDHHTRADAVPPPFDGARALARNPAYGYIEVYADGTLIPVDAEGLPVVPESSLS